MAAMQFWGVEVKGKEARQVNVERHQVIHLSQATLGELKKDNEPVTLHVKVGGKKLALGVMSPKNPQLQFDLVFDRDFEISHNWKNGSVHLLGYQNLPDDFEDFSGSSDEEEDAPIPQKENGKPAPTVAAPRAAAKPNKDVKPKLQEEFEDDSDDSDEDEEDSDDDSTGAEGMSIGDGSDEEEQDESDEDDDDEESSDEEPAKPAESGKKRPNADAKTPQSKKAKLATPQKTDGKKVVHEATPHPSKKGGKSPGSNKSTPKSGGQVSCGSCKKTFNSETALQSHSKAKHGGK